MPPKSKKSLNFWQKCEECSCILSVKDVANHHNYCSVPKSDWPCGYILDQTLYGTFEDIKSKDLSKDHIAEYEKNIVLLSQSAMQICGFMVGFPVIVEISDHRTILNAWPTSEGSLTTCFLNKEGQEHLAGCELKSSNVTISNLPEKPSFAKEVYFRILTTDGTVPNCEQFCKLIADKMKNKILFVDIIVNIPFYGKDIRLKITKVNTYEFDITSELENLSLTEAFYMTTEKTLWINESNVQNNEEQLNSMVKKIGGYASVISELEKNIFYTFSKNLEGDSPFSVLLYGSSGTGKTAIANYVAQKSNKAVINIQASELFSKFYGETESRLRQLFHDAKTKSPSVILIDNIDLLGSRKGTDQEKRVLSCLLSMFDLIRSSPIVVIATTVDPDILDSSLRRPGRLETEIEISIPNKEDRYEILKILLPDPHLDNVIKDLANSCHGYVGADLASLVDKAITQSVLNSLPSVSEEHLRWAYSQVRPSAMRQLQIHVPSVRWSDIGGGKDVRLRLEQAVEWPLKYADSLKRLGIKAPKGVLLYGPPGCSKTLVVKALATETNLNFISIKGSDVFSKWVGESEKAIRDLFRSARKVAPAIVFLDEADALGASRGSSVGSNVHDRVLSQLLTEMDGVNPLDGVVVVAATNRPDCIDKALLRPGRLDRIIYVPLPDYETRLQIFQIQLKKMPTSEVNVEELAKRTEGYSGAEVVAVCTEAALTALQEDMKASNVTMSHFESALSIVTPRTPKSLLNLYDEYRKNRESVVA